MIEVIMMGLLKANLAAAAAVVLVLALRKVVRGRLGARAAYALWLAPMLAAGAVLLPHPAKAPTSLAPIVLQAEALSDEFVAAATPASGPDVPALLLATWLAGGFAAAGLLARRQARFVTSLGRLTPLPERGLFRAERMGVGPAVVGVLRPKVVAPADFETRYAAGERALILAHEAAHLAGRDALANAAACLIQCLCWFNPLAHAAARLMRVDQELACDAAVVGRFPDQRRAYAELLLKTQLAAQPLPLGCHWPAGAEHPLKERIAMLKSPLPARAARRLGAAVALLACAGAATLAWAASPTPLAANRSVESVVTTRASGVSAPDADDVRVESATTRDTRPMHLAQSAQPIVTEPIWLKKPNGDDFAQLYPPGAAAAKLSGHAVMTCHIAGDGRLKACAVNRVDVEGDTLPKPEDDPDFGAATLRLVDYFQMAAKDKTGRPTAGGVITIPVLWRPPAKPATNPPGAMAVVRRPDWIEKPNGADFARFYPAEALKQNFEGTSVLSCGVDVTGRLVGCTATKVTTFGLPDAIRDDFRKATLELAGYFRMRPQTVNGAPTANGRINIPIRFSLPSDPEAVARLNALRDPGPAAPTS
jgi:beta-lactamase regulating signal transducer with metallopeptidase domain